MTDTPTSCLRIAHARFAPVGVDQHIGVEVVPDSDPPRLRLIFANPAYANYTCDPEDAHIVGKVLWTLRRV